MKPGGAAVEELGQLSVGPVGPHLTDRRGVVAGGFQLGNAVRGLFAARLLD